MLKIWGLYVKGLQSYRSTKFENGLTPDKVEPGLNVLEHALAVRQTFSWDLQLWQLVTLKPFDLQTEYLQRLQI